MWKILNCQDKIRKKNEEINESNKTKDRMVDMALGLFLRGQLTFEETYTVKGQLMPDWGLRRKV